MQEKINRYPGVNSFTEKEKDVFFGRKLDIENLMDLIIIRNQVLLYSKSGIGKSSLLEAGVLPGLGSRFRCRKIRFTAWIPKEKENLKQNNSDISQQNINEPHNKQLSPVEVIINNLLKDEEENQPPTILDKLIKGSDYKKTLWYYLKQKQLRGDTKTLLLVFDQFEELFTYPEHEINDFKSQIYELTQIYIADKLLELISRQTVSETDNYDALYEPVNVKFLYAIRSDRLDLLNRLSDKISNIQRDFYELKPLDEKQAYFAITKPAEKGGDEFNSPAFNFELAAIEKILSALTSGNTKTIETTQLQIVCSRIEKNIIASKLTEKPAFVRKKTDNLTLNVDDIPDFKDIFNEYYNDSINTLPENERDKAKKFIEDELIRKGQRISYDITPCDNESTKEILSKLVPTHLLRCEKNSIGHDSYELSHDTLVEPILESAKPRWDKEKNEKLVQEKAELEKEYKRQAEMLDLQTSLSFEANKLKELAEKNCKLLESHTLQVEDTMQKMKKASKKFFRLFFVTLVVSAIAILLAVYAFNQKYIAQAAEKVARREKMISDSLKKVAEDEKLNAINAKNRSDSLYKIADSTNKMFINEKVNNLFQKAKNLHSFDEDRLAVKYLEEAIALDSANYEVKLFLKKLKTEEK